MPLEQDPVEGDENSKDPSKPKPGSEPNYARVQLHHPRCWSLKQADYFLSMYPWIVLLDGKIGCRVRKEITKNIDMFHDHGMHLSPFEQGMDQLGNIFRCRKECDTEAS